MDPRLCSCSAPCGVPAETFNAGIVAKTSSGGVQIVVPAGWGADLDLNSSSGRIVLDGWKEASVGSAKSFRGQVGGGGPVIRMRSGSGNLELSTR